MWPESRPLATAADLIALEDDTGFEVVRGEIVKRGNGSFAHGHAQCALSALLRPVFHRTERTWWLVLSVDTELEPHEVYVPDAVGWRREPGREEPSGQPVRLRPDWVAEVLSPETAWRDLGPKLITYHRAGVPYIWIVDPEHEILTVYRWTVDGYLVDLVGGRSDRVKAAPFDEFEIEIAELF